MKTIEIKVSVKDNLTNANELFERVEEFCNEERHDFSRDVYGVYNFSQDACEDYLRDLQDVKVLPDYYLPVLEIMESTHNIEEYAKEWADEEIEKSNTLIKLNFVSKEYYFIYDTLYIYCEDEDTEDGESPLDKLEKFIKNIEEEYNNKLVNEDVNEIIDSSPKMSNEEILNKVNEIQVILASILESLSK